MGIHNIYKTVQELSNEMKMHVKSAKSVLDKFYIVNLKEGDNVKYIRNSMLIDKLICHIIILALIVHNYEMNGSQLATSLKLEIKRSHLYESYINYLKLDL